MNAMAFDVMLPLRQAIDEVSHDNTTRVVVLTGAATSWPTRPSRLDQRVALPCTATERMLNRRVGKPMVLRRVATPSTIDRARTREQK